MGITAGPTYTTDEGFVLSPIYLHIHFVNIEATEDTQPLNAIFKLAAFKSYEDRLAGKEEIHLPSNLSTVVTTIDPKDAFRQSVFGLAYDIVKTAWVAEGYTVENVLEPGQPLARQYVFDVSGLDIDGLPPP